MGELADVLLHRDHCSRLLSEGISQSLRRAEEMGEKPIIEAEMSTHTSSGGCTGGGGGGGLMAHSDCKQKPCILNAASQKETHTHTHEITSHTSKIYRGIYRHICMET